MKRLRGIVLAEMLVYVVLTLAAVSLISFLIYDLHRSQDHVRSMLDDVESASRLLADLKDDLRRSSGVAVEENRVTLRFGEGPETEYRFEPGEGSVHRRTGEDRAVYAFAFSGFRAAREAGRMVSLEVELRKHHPDGLMHPRIGTRVFCRHHEEVR